MTGVQTCALPILSWSELWGGTYDEKFDKYINDQFVGRDFWISVKSFGESLLLKKENNGIIYGKDDYLFSKYDKVEDETRYEENIKYLQEFYAKYPELNHTFMLIPNSWVIESEKLPSGAQYVDAEGEIERIYSALPEYVQTVDITEYFKGIDAELYYRTDHHWNTAGAYYGAKVYAESKGKKLPPLEDIPVMREVDEFFGTYFSKCKKIGIPSDTIKLYDIPVTSVEVAGEEKGSLYDESKFSTRDKYAGFLWGNNNLVRIKSENNLNKTENTSRVLVIKDSYANSFVPFLTYLYDEVDVIDLRYFMGLEQHLKDNAYDDILVMYNFETFTSDGNLPRLRY